MNPELGCRHRYIVDEKKRSERKGYFFRCVYCGKEIFGALAK